jgi:hypothetical protein
LATFLLLSLLPLLVGTRLGHPLLALLEALRSLLLRSDILTMPLAAFDSFQIRNLLLQHLLALGNSLVVVNALG